MDSSPVINGLALLAFALFWLTWKFLCEWTYSYHCAVQRTDECLVTWVMDQPDAQETGGLYVSSLSE